MTRYFTLSLSSLCFFISLLAKEMAVTLPLVLIFYEIIYSEGKVSDILKRKFLAYLAFLPPGAFYLFLRFKAMGKGVIQLSSADSLSERVLPMIGIFCDYMRLLLFPFNLNTLYPPGKSDSDAAVVFFIFLLISLILFFLFSSLRQFRRPLLFALYWAIAVFIPVSNIIPFSPNIKSEHFLYLPSAGFSLIAGIFIRGVLTENRRSKKNTAKTVA